MKKIFQLVAILIVLLVMASCAQAPTPIFVVVTSTPPPATQTPFVIVVTSTPIPLTPTETPLPTMTASPTSAGGQLTGKMVWLTGGAPVVGAGIMLCTMSGDKCQARAELTTTTQAGGAFEFQKLDAGTYVILYNPSGISPQAAGLSLDLSAQSLMCAAQGMMGSAPASCPGSVPIFGDGDLTMQKGASLHISPSGITLNEGSLVSKKYGVYLDFANGKPISAEILAGQSTETVVKVWDK